ncbi:MAG: hypothetical protein NLN65_08590, partial [Candidatus Poseidoniaceae archaeon]|nr:hypothetical protein [Candidatus Poseidoniaceae archaeon]
LEATKSSEADSYITSYENLKEMPWYGDAIHQIVNFYWEWCRLRKNMSKDIGDNTIRNILYDKIKTGTNKYHEDLAHYAREKDKSTTTYQPEDYSLKFLETILYRSVTIQRENKVKMDSKTAIKQGKRSNGKHGEAWADYGEDAAPAAEKGKKGKRKGDKGGGKGGKTSPPPPKAHDVARDPKLTMRSKAEMDEFCKWYQFDTCRHKTDVECPKKHQYLKKHEIEYLKELEDKKPKKKKGAKGEGKGGAKGKSKKGERGRSLSESKETTSKGLEFITLNGKKQPWCCMAFKKDGVCNFERDKGYACKFKHFTPAEFDDWCVKLANGTA